MLNFHHGTIFFPKGSYRGQKNPNVQPKKARMMQEYEFTPTDTFPTTASTSIQPSEQTLQNILSFARCQQSVMVRGMKVKVCMN